MTRDIKALTALLIENITKGIEGSTDSKTIKEFIDELEQEDDITATRLLFCMAIDCKNSLKIYGSLTPEENNYIKNLRACIIKAAHCDIEVSSFPMALTNRWKFAWALNNTAFEDRTPCIDCTNEPDYSRIYTFRAYLRWVVDINKQHNPGVDHFDGDPDEINRNYRKFKAGRKFATCKVSQLGYDRFVFVCNKKELAEIGYDQVDKIVDSLGLYVKDINDAEKFVCLNYDSSFNLSTWQPDSHTGDWGSVGADNVKEGNDFFLSYQHNDRFGRTFSVSGLGDQLKERVHLPFNSKGEQIYEMKAVDLGELESSIERDSAKQILEEAHNRYKQG